MKSAKILIVDDQQTNISLLKTQLKDYEVFESTSGRTALKMIMDNRPDLLLLDIMMPGIDGYSILSILKNTMETKAIPVIIISSAASEEQTALLEKGADAFIPKPFNPQELRDKVNMLLKYKLVQDELFDALNMLISLVEMHENKIGYLAGHSKRVAGYAYKLARKDVFRPILQEEIKLAALLHNIGNLEQPDSLFLKVDKLTDEEFKVVKGHPLAGEKICSYLKTLQPILPFIRHHHERFDGTGYPDGLKGTQIPVGARIIAIADAYDALTSDRPYRSAYSTEGAVKILRENSGTQWDPDLVELFSQIIDSGFLNEA